jgi:hypothetical protein
MAKAWAQLALQQEGADHRLVALAIDEQPRLP